MDSCLNGDDDSQQEASGVVGQFVYFPSWERKMRAQEGSKGSEDCSKAACDRDGFMSPSWA